MRIIKRSGAEVTFDAEKIILAITKANDSVVPSERMTPIQIKRIAEDVEMAASGMNRSLSVEEIQDMVEDQIMNQRAFEVGSLHLPLNNVFPQVGQFSAVGSSQVINLQFGKLPQP